MIAQNTIKNAYTSLQSKAVVHEAMRILSTRTTGRHWVCERCGMMHIAATPVACESCGSTTAPLQADLRREINSHW